MGEQLKYEENLWGKIDSLHEKYLHENSHLQNFIDSLEKYQSSCNDFSKSISNILAKNYVVVDNKNSSSYKTIESFFYSLTSHRQEFLESFENIKSRILDPVIKEKKENFKEEKEKYEAYRKARNQYNTSKQVVEKTKKEFNINAKSCENLVLIMLQNKMNTFALPEDIKKYKDKADESIKSAKVFEDRYAQSVEEANKCRENEIFKQRELLNYYQKLNSGYLSKLKMMIGLYITVVKKMYSSILLSVESLIDRYKNMNEDEDINMFIKNNKTNLKADEEIKYIPYYPTASLSTNSITSSDKKESENLDLNYDIITTFQKHFREIRTDLNMEEETKKKRLRFLSDKIFKIGPGTSFSPEEKKELISYLSEPKFRSYFIIILSKQRVKGRFQRSELLLNDLAEILGVILDFAQKEKDYENAKNCIILSQTFFYEKKEGGTKRKNSKDLPGKSKNEKIKKDNKIFLFEYIKKNKWLKSLEFWEGIIEAMIQNEIKKNDEINKDNANKESSKNKKDRISNIGFSQVLSYSNNMLEFNMSKKDILNIVDLFVKKYEIEKDMADAIIENINSAPDPVVEEEVVVEKEEKKIEEKKEEVKIEDKKEEVKIEEKKEEVKIEDKKEEENKEKEEEKKIEEGKNIWENLEKEDDNLKEDKGNVEENNPSE